MPIASREYVIKTMTKLMINPKKKYSQNFLTDEAVVKDSIDSLNLKPEEVVIEIGPGLGALTEEISKRKVYLYAYEIDSDMYNHLLETFDNYENIHLYNLDFLKVDLSYFNGKRVKVVSNVPYNLTTPIIEKILTSDIEIDSFTFMVQKEVYDRIKAKRGSKDYSPLNIFIEYVGKLSLIRKVTKDKFIPSPNVDSAILKIDFINNRLDKEIEKTFFKITKACFFQRRKTLLNNLTLYFNDKEKAKKLLSQMEIQESTRGEQLEVDDFIKMSRLAHNFK